MKPTPKTTKEKRAVQFAVDLLTKHGYGYIVNVPSRTLAKELTEKGYPISFVTIRTHWKTLIKLGLVKSEMKAKLLGVTYHLNRYAFNKIIRSMKEVG